MNLPLRTEWEYHYPTLMSHLEMFKFSVVTLRNVPVLIPCLDFMIPMTLFLQVETQESCHYLRRL